MEGAGGLTMEDKRKLDLVDDPKHSHESDSPKRQDHETDEVHVPHHIHHQVHHKYSSLSDTLPILFIEKGLKMSSRCDIIIKYSSLSSLSNACSQPEQRYTHDVQTHTHTRDTHRRYLSGNTEPSLVKARRHLLESSCTLYDDEKKDYCKLSLWSTNMVDLGHFGVGVRLYFKIRGDSK
jgi:hypothetical protein